MSESLEEYHNALGLLQYVAGSLMKKSAAFETLRQKKLSDELMDHAELIQNCVEIIRKEFGDQLTDHLRSQQIGQSVMLSTLVHFGNRAKENQPAE